MRFDAVEIIIKNTKWTHNSYQLSGDREDSEGTLNANVGFYYYPRESMTSSEALSKLRHEMVKARSKRAEAILVACNELMGLNF